MIEVKMALFAIILNFGLFLYDHRVPSRQKTYCISDLHDES